MIIPGWILLSLGFFGCSGAIAQIQCLLYCVRSIVFLSIDDDYLEILVFLDYGNYLSFSNDNHHIFYHFSI